MRPTPESSEIKKDGESKRNRMKANVAAQVLATPLSAVDTGEDPQPSPAMKAAERLLSRQKQCHKALEKAAFFLYLQRGKDGHELENWLQAEERCRRAISDAAFFLYLRRGGG